MKVKYLNRYLDFEPEICNFCGEDKYLKIYQKNNMEMAKAKVKASSKEWYYYNRKFEEEVGKISKLCLILNEAESGISICGDCLLAISNLITEKEEEKIEKEYQNFLKLKEKFEGNQNVD